jgi:hypothetical protein
MKVNRHNSQPPSQPTHGPEWVRYYASAVLVRTASLSGAAELAHRRFADFHWSTGRWPGANGGNPPSLGHVPPRKWESVELELHKVGWRWRKADLCHPEVAKSRREAIRFLQARAAAGGAGAKRRWGRRSSARVAEPKVSHSKAKAELEVSEGKAVATHGTDGTDGTQSTHLDKALSAERLPRSVSPLEKPQEGEAAFIADVVRLCESHLQGSSEPEIENWGGWWRNRYRESPQKAGKVLAEVRVLVREGRITRSPGAAAMDLWGRLP